MPEESRTPEHIHTPKDGRGRRQVWLNGIEVTHVVYADTEEGLIRQFVQPYEIDPKTNECRTVERRGLVVVKFRDGEDGHGGS